MSSRQLCALYYTNLGNAVFQCNLCNTTRKQAPNSGYSNLVSHLTAKHSSYATYYDELQYRNSSALDNFGFVDERTRDIAKWMKWLVARNLPLSEVVAPGTRSVVTIQPVTARTLKKYMQHVSAKVGASISAEMGTSFGLMLDGWTSHSIHFLGLFAVAIDGEDRLSACSRSLQWRRGRVRMRTLNTLKVFCVSTTRRWTWFSSLLETTAQPIAVPVTDLISRFCLMIHIWRVTCTVACQHMWLRRNEAAFREVQLPVTAFVRSTWKAVERQLEVLLAPPPLRTTQYRPPFPAFQDLWSVLTAFSDDEPPPATDVRLYFDGGARGNPGIAGSGCLLLERCDPQTHWSLVWWTSVYLGTDKTNNYAEHAALAAGIRECADRYQPQRVRLHIIGDSRLVLHHVLGIAKLKTCSLRRAADLTARELGQYPHLTLSHTLRAGNTMADHLANLAMDTRHTTTSSPIWTSVDVHLASLLPSDTVFPITPITRQPTTDLLHELDPLLTRLQLQPPD